MIARFIRFALCSLLACVAMLGPSKAKDPWEFPGGAAERETATKKYPDPWYLNFRLAREAVEKSQAAKADEIIARLRLAIDGHPGSNKAAVVPTTKETFEYFPYYYLARALLWKNEEGLAQMCLEKEFGLQVILQSKLLPQARELKEDLALYASRRDILDQAGKVLRWAGAEGAVSLAPASAEKLARIKDLEGKLKEPGAADVKSLTRDLIAETINLCKEELQRREPLTKELVLARWSGAFEPQAGRLDPGVCQAPTPDEKSLAGMQRAVAALERCSTTVAGSLRKAGRWACDRLRSAKADVEEKWRVYETLSKAGGTSPEKQGTIPEPPASCAISWEKAPYVDVEKGFTDLREKLTGVETALTARKQHALGLIEREKGGFLAKLTSARDRLPIVPPDCVQVLQLGEVATTIRTLRERLSPREVPDPMPSDLARPDALVEKPLSDLRERVRSGCQRLVGETCPDVTRANLDSLPSLSEAFLKGTEGLEKLCAAASRAEADLRSCWIARSELVRKQVTEYASLVGAAVDAQAAGEPRLPCLGNASSALRAVGGGAANAAWIGQVRSALTEAQSCLREFSNQTEEGRAEAMLRLGQVKEAVKELTSSKEIPDVIREQVARIESHLPRIDSDLAKIAPLFENAPADIDSLRRALEAAGLEGGLGDELWGKLGSLQRDDPGFFSEALRASRSSVVAPSIAAARIKLVEWQPLLHKLGPFLALKKAFSRFAGGDLDGAVSALREAQAKGKVPPEGKEAARFHAALSYFLYTKKVALSREPAAGQVARLLDEDSRREAGMAVEADATLELDVSLFRSSGFRDFYSAERAQRANR